MQYAGQEFPELLVVTISVRIYGEREKKEKDVGGEEVLEVKNPPYQV